MNYLQKRFSVHLGQSDSFRDNYDRAFGKAGAPHIHTSVEPLPDPLEREDSAAAEPETVSVTITLSAAEADVLKKGLSLTNRAARNVFDQIRKALWK